jgi:hypothetical protein
MRVVLYYDLLRFSPCSIDLFIYEHFSPPITSIQHYHHNTHCSNAVQKVLYFRWVMRATGLSSFLCDGEVFRCVGRLWFWRLSRDAENAQVFCCVNRLEKTLVRNARNRQVETAVLTGSGNRLALLC